MTTNKDKRRRELQQLQQRRSRGAPPPAASRPKAPAPSLWAESAEDDPRARLRQFVGKLAKERGYWTGVPLPLADNELVIHPSYPFAAALGRKKKDEPAPDFTVRNSFHSSWKHCDIYVIQKPDASITFGFVPAVHGALKQLETLGCSDAWGMDQEQAALATLRSLVTPRQWRHYMMTGSFLESSKRSGVTYMFRRLRPTIAIAPDNKGGTNILCCLCMHPIAHYEGTWAGAMCPTDDVLAHLTTMRGDEAMFWRRSNQHPAYRPESGL